MATLLHTPKIAYDTLVEVIDVLANEGHDKDRDAIVALSQTCRYLRMEGTKRLLSRPVRVNLAMQPHRVAAFCHFMLGDPIVRLPLLRHLTITFHLLSEGVARSFADVLGGSCCLEGLRIYSLFDVTKPVLVTICSAISSLTSLQNLTVESCKYDDPSYTQIFYRAFQTIQSPLTSVQLFVPSTELPSPCIIYMRSGDPIFVLSRLTGSLRRVVFSDGIIRVGGGVRVYPLVEELEIASYVGGMPALEVYVQCFPNLRHLRCGSRPHYLVPTPARRRYLPGTLL